MSKTNSLDTISWIFGHQKVGFQTPKEILAPSSSSNGGRDAPLEKAQRATGTKAEKTDEILHFSIDRWRGDKIHQIYKHISQRDELKRACILSLLCVTMIKMILSLMFLLCNKGDGQNLFLC